MSAWSRRDPHDYSQHWAAVDRGDPYETITISGHGHDDEIAEIEYDLRNLDYDDPDFAEKQAALLAERAQLKWLP